MFHYFQHLKNHHTHPPQFLPHQYLLLLLTRLQSLLNLNYLFFYLHCRQLYIRTQIEFFYRLFFYLFISFYSFLSFIFQFSNDFIYFYFSYLNFDYKWLYFLRLFPSTVSFYSYYLYLFIY